MKKIAAIEYLHRCRLTPLESALKQARGDQMACEEALSQRRVAEAEARAAGLKLRQDIDVVLFTGAVTRADIGKAQHQLTAAKESLLAARQAVESAEAALADAMRRTDEALRVWRVQAAKVEKFDAFVQILRTGQMAEVMYREEMETEDLARKRA